jgi:hypothetical protein
MRYRDRRITARALMAVCGLVLLGLAVGPMFPRGSTNAAISTGVRPVSAAFDEGEPEPSQTPPPGPNPTGTPCPPQPSPTPGPTATPGPTPTPGPSPTPPSGGCGGPEPIVGDITGTITAGGAPITEMPVVLCRSAHCVSAQTDISGTYLFTSLAAGSFKLYLYPGFNPGFEDRTGPVTLTSGTAVHDVELPGGSLTGQVTDRELNVVHGAWVQACIPDECRTVTAADGTYAIDYLFPADYTVTVYPPNGDYFATRSDIPATITDEVLVRDVVLNGPEPLPADGSTSLAGSGVLQNGPGLVPVIVPNQDISIQTLGCTGGSATFTLDSVYTGQSTSGVLAESPTGVYSGVVNAPFTGASTMTISIDCPSSPDEETSFSVYIDPSGFVYDQNGQPLIGATVTLFRSDVEVGPFVQLPDGDAAMSPSNRVNPDTTDATGHFGWDVVAGFYKVRVEAPRCADPAKLSTPFVESAVYEIPPPVTDISLVLFCDSDAPRIDVAVPASGASYTLGSTNFAAYSCDDGAGSGVVSCSGSAPNGALLDTSTTGSKQLTITAADRFGNVATRTVTYAVYSFSGFELPISSGLNRTQAASAVAVKFKVVGVPGTLTLASARVDCATLSPVGAASTVAIVAAGQVHYNWKTDKAYDGTCRSLLVMLSNGQQHVAYFDFRKKS